MAEARGDSGEGGAAATETSVLFLDKHNLPTDFAHSKELQIAGALIDADEVSSSSGEEDDGGGGELREAPAARPVAADKKHRSKVLCESTGVFRAKTGKVRRNKGHKRRLDPRTSAVAGGSSRRQSHKASLGEAMVFLEMTTFGSQGHI
jgi:hypothetical protein